MKIYEKSRIVRAWVVCDHCKKVLPNFTDIYGLKCPLCNFENGYSVIDFKIRGFKEVTTVTIDANFPFIHKTVMAIEYIEESKHIKNKD